MSVSLNWQPIVGGMMFLAGFIWIAVLGVKWAWNGPKSSKSPIPELTDAWAKWKLEDAKPVNQAKRAADEPAPPGAVEWVADIIAAMGSAKAESVLSVLKDGATRDQARMVRIAELEASSETKA